MENDEGTKVRVLLDKATNSTAAEVDPRLLKGIKSMVRISDAELRTAANYLMDLMKREHSQVRYLSLLIIDELFMRSKLFRTIIVEKFDLLLSLSVGFRRNSPLPPPASVASTLRLKGIELLEKWNISFGIHYRQIRLGYDYLKNTLRLQFPNIQVIQGRLEQERRDREERSAEIVKNKFNKLKDDFPLIKEEIQATIDEVERCLSIARPLGEDVAPVPLDEDDCQEFRSSELRNIRLNSLRESGIVHEDNENRVIFDTLRELNKLLVTKHLVCIQEWITVVLKVETPDRSLRDSMLKDLIDIRNSIQSAKQECGESIFCSVQNWSEKDEEDDFWVEGQQSGMSNLKTSNKVVDKSIVVAKSEVRKREVPSSADEKQNLDGQQAGGSEMDPLKNKLLSEAPVIKWGSFLDNWGSKDDILINQRGLDLDNHWGRVDYDAVISAEKVSELNVRATLYQEDHKIIHPCGAPLRNGGFCQRKDLKVCPFHGPIVPRDSSGNVIVDGASTSNSFAEQDESLPNESLSRELAKQAIKNVRDKDMERLSQKRAKLALIREHNEGVLRDAALASTSSTSHLGENVHKTRNERAKSSGEKATLSSMLRKRVTTKDRLAQRLLNSRASNASTRQLSSNEDTNYREAFPNQW